MLKKIVISIILVSVSTISYSAENKAMDQSMHSTMKGDTVSGAMRHVMAESVMLGEEEVDGVKMMIHLTDVKEKMAAAGMPHTHNIMSMFVDTMTWVSLNSGQVTLKVTGPDAKERVAQKMMGMSGQFGIGLVLDKLGTYHFKISTIFLDGKKRQFHGRYEVK